MIQNRRRNRRMPLGTLICLLLGLTLVFILVAACLVWNSMRGTYLTEPACQPVSDTEASASSPAPYPSIDWHHWKKENGDLIAWITIPGTRINYPVVHATAQAPDYYLEHDIHRNPNYYGCIFLDSVCSPTMLSMNSILYGHNMTWDNEMFGDLESFTDPAFAAAHRRVLVQTPREKRAYTVVAATVVNGERAEKRLAFETNRDFRSWWRNTYRDAAVQLEEQAPRCARVLTLCTCSYHQWDNERTLVFAIPDTEYSISS